MKKQEKSILVSFENACHHIKFRQNLMDKLLWSSFSIFYVSLSKTNPASNCMFKVKIETLEQGVKYVQS